MVFRGSWGSIEKMKKPNHHQEIYPAQIRETLCILYCFYQYVVKIKFKEIKP